MGHCLLLKGLSTLTACGMFVPKVALISIGEYQPLVLLLSERGSSMILFIAQPFCYYITYTIHHLHSGKLRGSSRQSTDWFLELVSPLRQHCSIGKVPIKNMEISIFVSADLVSHCPLCAGSRISQISRLRNNIFWLEYLCWHIKIWQNAEINLKLNNLILAILCCNSFKYKIFTIRIL